MFKNIFILTASIFIYAYLGLHNFALILLSIISTYLAARLLNSKRKKFILAATIILNGGILTAIRFLPQNVDLRIWISLGISYYTLMVISYLVDVYRGKIEAERNLFKYTFYVMFIPHLFVGPISTYEEIKPQIDAKRKITLNNFYNGSLRIAWGLLKIFVIARRASIIIAEISSSTDVYTGAYALLALFMYSILLYADFSGAIDIVLGISKIFGYNLIENFNAPYLSQNIKEFWRRWHISLGRWLKNYIYIPLGGSRKGAFCKIIAVSVAFIVSGIWHGVSFLLWGILHGLFVLLGNKYSTKFKWLNRAITFIIVSFLWSFFIWQGDTLLALRMTGTIFTNFNWQNAAANILNLGLSLYDWIVLAIFSVILFTFDAKKATAVSKIKQKSPEFKTALLCTVILLIIVFGIYGLGFNAADFIYGNF